MHIPYVKYASVILDLSMDKALDYGISSEQEHLIRKGSKVEVPLRGQLKIGYVFEIKNHPNFPSVRPIQRVLSENSFLSDDLLELAAWMSKYYCTSLNNVLQTLLPSTIRKDIQHKQQLFVMRAKTREDLSEICSQIRNKSHAQASVIDELLKVKKGILLSELLEKSKSSRSTVDALAKKGLIVIDIVRVDRSPLVNEDYFPTKPKQLNHEQSQALDKILTGMQKKQFETHLIHGVTGSGKTEIYLQAINKNLQEGKGAIVLVPEVSLTAQTIERFRSRFETNIAVLHHRLSKGERFDEWHKIREGRAKIVIGARSAIFSPIQNLGLIIVDEEHEQSYKQTDGTPCYHARDVAVMRGKLTNSVVILGSATPSLESYYNAQQGKYILSNLKGRADVARFPSVKVVDLKEEKEKNKGMTSFSDALLSGIKKRQSLGEQTILFLNRRGYHTTLLCQQCTHIVKCKHCDVTLTYHFKYTQLICHQCGFTQPPPIQCPECSSTEAMKYRGIGTEHVERTIKAILPDIRTLRIDADTTRHKGSHQKLLRDFGNGKADVLIGTQMIAKGLHFPQVTLVGILNSDTNLNLPDFRASEIVFQLITQVAGRSGRGELPGEVIIHTYLPDNRTIILAAKQDYEQFYAEEIQVRQMFNYPPFTKIVKIAFSGPNETQVMETGTVTYEYLRKHLPATFELYPLVASGHAKVKDHYRFQFLIKGPSIYSINRTIDTFLHATKLPSKVKVLVDIDPTSTFF